MGEDILTIGQINNVLSCLSTYDLKRKYELVSESEDPNCGRELEQCEYSYRTYIFKLNIQDLHLKVMDKFDSYGDYQGIESIKIVKPIVRQVTDFE